MMEEKRDALHVSFLFENNLRGLDYTLDSKLQSLLQRLLIFL